jgi:hypothetical protein
MNRENYKKSRYSPKRTSSVSRAKTQMLAKPKAAPVNVKLCEKYKTQTEWITKVIPKLQEK